ncbi:hypothetical protein OKA04_02135 [Luteolibacter flavescens]|uniref:Uncharacterized protein n=1 Tax=Luteolibacter flavescens TaxID=1859460 RepID=A0ABT3FIX3_9BACT|nr:hypothetical protein [Luteolibacter flavescens]MCW1883508.1 hypothetical protein [Luteolibacter flavescens]
MQASAPDSLVISTGARRDSLDGRCFFGFIRAAMDFEEADYFVLKHRRIHRAASAVFAGIIALAFLIGPNGSAPKSAAALIFPLAAIWFADELSDDAGSSSGWLDGRQRALVFRWVGWFGLGAFAFLAGSRF